MNILFFALLGCVLQFAKCKNVLVMCDTPSPSHQIWNYALAEGLMQKGHNITFLSPDANKMKPTDKYHPILIEGLEDHIHDNYDLDNAFSSGIPLVSIKVFTELAFASCNFSLYTNGFKTLMDYPADFKFDLIIIDLTMSFCLIPFVQRFNYPPAIGMTAFLLPPYLSHVFGNDVQPAYLPFYHTNYDDDMNLFQRTSNYLLIHFEMFVQHYYIDIVIERMTKKVFGAKMDSIPSLKNRLGLLLSNIDQHFQQAQPLTPNIIPVGGLHTRPAKELPKDLQEILDNAKNGAIFFCLGTNVQSNKLDLTVRKNLLDAFKRLKQTVLWKFESNLTDLPKNVIIRKWMPQNDILGHPNIKLFISHGGGLSTHESAYHGVPIVGIPFFVDQLITVSDMVKKGLAKKLDLLSASSQEIYNAIQEVLTNPLYANKMKAMSRRMLDQPETPLQRAVFWSEYAMKHDGGNYLKPKSKELSLFVLTNMDVKIFLAFLAYLVFYLLTLVCRKIRAVVYQTNKKKQQ